MAEQDILHNGDLHNINLHRRERIDTNHVNLKRFLQTDKNGSKRQQNKHMHARTTKTHTRIQVRSRMGTALKGGSKVTRIHAARLTAKLLGTRNL